MAGSVDRVEERRNALVATVAIGTYTRPQLNRPRLASVREKFAGLAVEHLGFGIVRHLEGDGTRDSVWRGIEEFVSHPAERKILYWTGHGHEVAGGYYLACRDSYDADRAADTLLPERAVFLEQLVQRISQGPADVLLIIDACRAASPMRWIRPRLLLDELMGTAASPAGRLPGFAVICTTGEQQPAEEGRWVDWLEQVLNTPDLTLRGGERLFDPRAAQVRFVDLVAAIGDVAEDTDAPDTAQLPDGRELRPLPHRFLHNGHYEGTLRPQAVRPADHGEWLGRGLARDGAGALGGGPRALRRFSGRQRALSRIVTWLEIHSNGMLAVTGPAGCGKTMLLSFLAHLTIPEFCDGLPPSAPPLQARPRFHSIHAALHCHGKTVRELSGDLRRALAPLAGDGPPPSAEPGFSPQECVRQVAAISERSGALNLVFDGLDEAAAGLSADIARDLLNPLAACPGIKVLVGTRKQPRRSLPGSVRVETLYEAMEQTVPQIALDRDDDTEHDIARHVQGVLTTTEGSPYAPRRQEQSASRVAKLVARHSNRLFLVADLCARDLARGREPLPADRLAEHIRSGTAELNAQIARELRALDETGRLRVAEVLRPLALAQGAGLPHGRIWLAMADAVASGHEPLTQDQLDTVLQRTDGTLVTRALDGDDEVYRLQHPSFGSQLLADAGEDLGRLHDRVFLALFHLCGGRWETAGRYIQRHLPAHAALSSPENLDKLVRDPRFLVHSDPDVMLPLVSRLAAENDWAAAYRRVADDFRHRPAATDREALLRATALASHREVSAELSRLPVELWKDLWTDAPAEPLDLRWPAPAGGAFAVVWTPSAGGLLTSAGRGAIVTRRPETGEFVRGYTTGSARGRRPDAMRAVVEIGTGERRVVVGQDGRGVYLWLGNDHRPAQRLFWGGAPHDLTATEFGGTAFMAVTEGRQVWLWQWPMGRRPSADSIEHARLPVPAVRVRLLALEHKLLILAGDDDGLHLHELSWRSWAGQQPVVSTATVTTHLTAPLTAVAALAREGDHGWVAAAERDAVRVWSVTAPLGGKTTAKRVLEFSAHTRGLALGMAGDTPLVATHEQGMVTVRSLDGGQPWARVPTADQHPSLSFDPLRSGRLAVADGSHVRLLHTEPARPDPALAHRLHSERSVLHLAPGAAGEPHLLCRVMGGDVLFSHHAPGRPPTGEPMVAHHREPVTAVCATRTGRQWTAVTVAGRAMRIWRLPGQLDRPGQAARQEAELLLPGDPGETVPSVGLQRLTGRLLCFVPDQQGLRCWTADLAAAGGARHWQQAPFLHFRNAVGARWVSSVSATHPDGDADGAWVAADCVTSLNLWRLSADGALQDDRQVTAPHPTRTAAIGTRRDGGDLIPLLAWAAEDGIRLAECDLARPKGEPLEEPGDRPPERPAALVFTGPPTRPLLLACGGSPAAVSIWDVVKRRWLPRPSVPDRGFPVEAAAAAFDREGATLMLQGRRRCDQLLLSGSGLARQLDIPPQLFGP